MSSWSSFSPPVSIFWQFDISSFRLISVTFLSWAVAVADALEGEAVAKLEAQAAVVVVEVGAPDAVAVDELEDVVVAVDKLEEGVVVAVDELKRMLKWGSVTSESSRD